ncbi:MAG TPA: endonuclease MutS2 [Firmicutes bacterium]|nr:endonuclease MutS2 [Bacillota bacterium]
MNDNTLRVLEWQKVREMLAARAAWSGGKELALALVPSSDRDEVREALEETAEAWGWLNQGKSLPLGGAADIRPLLARARLGGVLEPSELLAVGDCARAMRRCRAFLEGLGGAAPRLSRFTGELSDTLPLEEEIARCIDEQVGVRDSASERLGALRREVRREQSRAREYLETFARTHAQLLQEPIVTLRNGRFVLPVRSECRSQVPGIIHDQSGSGATLFIEPLGAVTINNRVRELEAMEEEEVERILRHLSGRVGVWAPRLEAGLQVLARLDLVEAKARLALDQEAVCPQLVEGGVVELIGARHPLLRGEVVPIDLRVGRPFRALLVTGPNTGGKTVSVKTAGLLVLMAQAGLFVPAKRAEISVFQQVFADIGDEQSIEQSLSTFSGHLRVIREILERANPATLVILDELGAGTDPVEGAALAQAVLEVLLERGARVVATTHLGSLKLFAYEHPEIENAAVTFDLETLRPTYHLVMGAPGRSMALAIARRLGLPEEVITRAARLVGETGLRLEDVVSDLESERQQVREERLRLERARVEAEELKERYAEEVARVESLRRELTARGERQLEAALRRALEELNELVGTARRRLREEVRAETAVQAVEEARKKAREAGEKLVTGIAGALPGPVAPGLALSGQQEGDGEGTPSGPVVVRRRPLQAGDRVRLRRTGQEGVVRSTGGAGEAEIEVQVGVIRLHVGRDEVEPVDALPSEAGVKEPEKTGGAQVYAQARAARQTLPVELDLRGERVEEALLRVDRFLDQAVLAGLPWVRLIHGKGTGALRQAVHQCLQQDRRVARFRLGEPGEGGSGVTVAWLA